MSHSISKGRGAVLVATAGVMALTLGACSGSTSSSGGSGQFAAVVKGLDNPFFQSMESGINDQASDSGVEVTVQAATSITDTTGQADKLNGLAGQNFSCFIVNPITGTNLVQGIASLSAKNIPIVNIDSPIDADAATAANAKIATYIGTDNNDAGAQAAAEMGRLLPGGGTVALIGGTSGDVTSAARLDGFTAAVPPNITIVATVAADWERQMALTRATDLMTANPTLSAFFVANDDMGLGVAQAIANKGMTGKIKVISVDGNKEAFEAVKTGGIDAVVAQFPYVIGAMGVEACKAAAAGKELPANVKAPVQVVTKANVDDALASAPKPAAPYDDPFAELAK
ncbi:substrate-binding domain-containing protein [Mycolicibacterium iranicum]|uniref:Substrate-binding domain-containing protein n=1 Tax=Mycolicibacterium iranicum TaxID=912594 RepID=A0ABT4H9B3_MYCIR|nr:substrate-binding domain-containing protein [Mycolicibacterium iranicum]MCZ0726543.1 substrate-binding domain-containing protein [Mycolicibacterium iranicum]